MSSSIDRPFGADPRQKERQAVSVLRMDIGMYRLAYDELGRVLDQACACLEIDAITIEESNMLRTAILQFHNELKSASMREVERIRRQAQDQFNELYIAYRRHQYAGYEQTTIDDFVTEEY